MINKAIIAIISNSVLNRAKDFFRHNNDAFIMKDLNYFCIKIIV